MSAVQVARTKMLHYYLCLASREQPGRLNFPSVPGGSWIVCIARMGAADSCMAYRRKSGAQQNRLRYVRHTSASTFCKGDIRKISLTYSKVPGNGYYSYSFSFLPAVPHTVCRVSATLAKNVYSASSTPNCD